MIHYSDEVQNARERNLPIVALESTIISHGMPYPINVETAREVEAIVREQGAVPATIAILDGKIKVGLHKDELEFLGDPKNRDAISKVSRRDLAYVLSMKQHGATTVAATMICANLAGINVFVTGGIGGVHRGAQTTMDISADLEELAKTDVAVVCAGAKSILDIGLTLEYLETHGVPVIGYQTDDFPAFYSRKSGFSANFRVDDAATLADVLVTKWSLGLHGGAVIANPVPEAEALDTESMEAIIQNALEEAAKRQIKGKEVTPFLLDRITSLTDGTSLKTNVALVKNNAKVGARLAVELANRHKK